MRERVKRIQLLLKENTRMQERIISIRKKAKKDIEKIRDSALNKAHLHIKERSYNPPKRDLLVHSTLLLVRKSTLSKEDYY